MRKYIVSHFQPHPEEIGGILVMRQNPATFPGADKAKVVFVLDPKFEKYNDSNAYFVGVRPDSGLDEHMSDHKSSFSIIAKKLGGFKGSVWDRFLKYVNKADSADNNGSLSRGGPLNLYSMVDCVHWMNEGSSEEGFNWCAEGLRAVEDVGGHYFQGGKDNFGEQIRFFELICCLWAANRFSKQNVGELVSSFFPAKGECQLSFWQVITQIKRNKDRVLTCNKEINKKGLGSLYQDRHPWSLPRMTWAIYRKNLNYGRRRAILAARRWASKALDAHYDRQKEFHHCCLMITRGEVDMEFTEMWPNSGKRALVKVPNNQYRMMLAACRYKLKEKFGVLVQRNPVTGIQVFANSQGFNPLDEVVARIRKKESKLLNMSNGHSWKELKAPGNVCGLDHIYYVVQKRDKGKKIGSNMILNRSRSRPSSKIMKIEWRELLQAVRSGLAANCRR